VRRLEDVQPLYLADVGPPGGTLPVHAWLVDGRVLVDTGMIDTTPELEEEWAVELRPWPDLPGVEAVINTHLHFDHCGGNRRFAGLPMYVQRAELAAVSEPDYLVGWVRFDGADYRELDGDTDLSGSASLFDGISVLSTPGHSPGHQCVVVETVDGPVVLGGDVTYSMEELVAGGLPNFDRIHALRPRRVYLAHVREPWDPRW
jgi:N-acyl homoserine lactone hydrolase